MTPREQTLEHECARLTEELALARALNAELADALSWAMDRINRMAPHQASEGDGELYRFCEAHAALAKATGATHD